MLKFLFLAFLLNVSVSIVLGFCSTNDSSIAKYEEIKNLPNHPEILLIDVRTLKEVQETGRIPTSIHISIDELREKLSSTTDKEAFLKKHGRKFPEPEDQLIFYCLRGGRAQQAMEIACSLGFKRSRFYKGSWQEWSEKEGLNKTGKRQPANEVQKQRAKEE